VEAVELGPREGSLFTNASARAAIVLAACLATAAVAQIPDKEILSIGGFRCVDLKPLKNDSFFDLYATGFWSYSSFRMDIWKRHGVPFWYPVGAGTSGWPGPSGSRLSVIRSRNGRRWLAAAGQRGHSFCQ